jgi:hypothetical protein
MGIEASGCTDTIMLSSFTGDANLKPQQVQYYLNKFHLCFKAPYAYNEDLAQYQIWWDENEAKGTWLGYKTTFEAIIEREAEFANEIKVGTVPSMKDMIDAAKHNPMIKTLGDWEIAQKSTR